MGVITEMALLPWLSFSNRLMKLSYFGRSVTIMIDFNVYKKFVFVFREK